jgi:hypothetical protein
MGVGYAFGAELVTQNGLIESLHAQDARRSPKLFLA